MKRVRRAVRVFIDWWREPLTWDDDDETSSVPTSAWKRTP